jgi:hypothetical protein
MAQVTARMTRKRACQATISSVRDACCWWERAPLESSPHFIHLARAMAGEARPRLLCASPRFPPRGLVDEWLPLVPGSSASFLLGILHVLLREQLGDESVLESASGFLPWSNASGSTQPGLARAGDG